MNWKKRFFTKVRKTKGCWYWTAGKFADGYGAFGLDNKTQRAHRVSWIIYNGRIPKGLCVLHRCDNPSCVNPKHLWLGTNSDNMHDRDRKKRNGNTRGENSGTARLIQKQVVTIRKLYSTKNIFQRELAKRFNVSRPHISDIVNRKKWSHVN